MITSITMLIDAINEGLAKWDDCAKPWFRGESDTNKSNNLPLCPKIVDYSAHEENHLLQSFRRQAGGFENVPLREYEDMWLFLAQHYGIPTRLLDWTEGALHAIYFAINKEGHSNPRIYMLNPRKLNERAGPKTFFPNYPLTWGRDIGSAQYVTLAWGNRTLDSALQEILSKKGIDLDIPVAFPATYQDKRMIAQRSCFTIHGTSLAPLQDILRGKSEDLNNYLFEFKIDINERNNIMKELSILGISAATIFPDLDRLASDLVSDLKIFNK